MNHDPNLPKEYYQAVAADAMRVAAESAYVAGRLKSAVEYHLIWLEGLAQKLGEKDMTREERRAFVGKGIRHLREILDDAWISRT